MERIDLSRTSAATAGSLIALTAAVLTNSQAIAASTWSPPKAPCIQNSTGYSAACSMWFQANTSTTVASVCVQGWARTGSNPIAIDTNILTKSNFEGYWTTVTPGGPLICLTCNLTYLGNALAGGQRGISDLFVASDNTRYVIVTAELPEEKTNPPALGRDVAKPGVGLDNAIYIVKADSNGKPLDGLGTPVHKPPLDGSHGIIWARVNSTGTKLVWAEMYHPSTGTSDGLLGWWQLMSADLNLNTVPATLSNIASFPATQPQSASTGAAFYEPYGFAPNGNVIFSSSLANPSNQTNNQIFTMPASLTGTPKQLKNGKAEKEDNEFAFFYDKTHIMYAGTTRNDHWFWYWGLDYWIQQVDPDTYDAVGSPQLLTQFNSTEYANVGGWAPNPDPTKHELLMGACEGLNAWVLNPCPGSDIWDVHVTPVP